LLLVRLNLLVFACLIPWRAPPCVCRGRRIWKKTDFNMGLIDHKWYLMWMSWLYIYIRI
jgi:hypothetical protein